MTTRLATPGAVLLLVGVVLMWWGSGIFRGDTSHNGQSTSPPDTHDHSTPGFGGGSSGGGGGASGSF